MGHTTDFSLQQFDVFIAYHETEEGKRFAEITKKVLNSSFSLTSFVAHDLRNTYSTDSFDIFRDKVIKKCKFFLFINTQEALTSQEIKKEVKMAYPNGPQETPKLIILRHDSS